MLQTSDMSKGEQNSSLRLKDGDDSGSVADGVRHQVFVDGLGICAAPDCNERAVHHRTKLAECAHIIPRRVGSHPREDYKTSLDQRNQEANLLYLCERHHKVVDNVAHAKFYTAEVLREWKRTHEEWARSVTKESPYLPNALKEVLASMGRTLAIQAGEGKVALSQLIEVGRNLILSNRVAEAEILLAQISTLAINTNDEGLVYEIDFLNARILRATQNVPASKAALLDLIHSHNTKSEAMVEYVELCRAAPEPVDELEKIERLLRDLDPQNPHLIVLDLIEGSHGLLISRDALSPSITQSRRLFEKILIHNCIALDATGERDARDELIQEWSERFETSSKPLLFQAIFASVDALRSESSGPTEVSDSIVAINRIKDQLHERDPLSAKDELIFGFHEFRLASCFARISGKEQLMNRCWEGLLQTLDECYFDTLVFELLGEILEHVPVSVDEWKRIYRKLKASCVVPSREFVDMLFLRGFERPELDGPVAELLDTHGDPQTCSLWDLRLDLDVVQIIRNLKEKNNHVFSLVYLRFVQSKSPELAIEVCDQLLIDSSCKIDLLFVKLRSFQELDRKDQCLEVIRGISFAEVSLYGVEIISRIAFGWREWDLFVRSSVRVLEVAPTPELHARLAMAYAELYDDNSAIFHAEIALGGSGLKEGQTRNTLCILIESLQLKGKEDDACRKFEEYAGGSDDFHALMLGANAYIKSSFLDRGELALSLVFRAFRSIESIDDDVYLSAYVATLDLANSGVIKVENLDQVCDGVFIKVEGILNWFYLGEKRDSMGAVSITKLSKNYEAVTGRRINESIDWPADRFSSLAEGRKIESILSPGAFLCQRAHEAMEAAAKSGEKPIWEVQVLSEDGSLDIENLRKFSISMCRQSEEFFDMYAGKVLPFSLLCKNEGGAIQAIGRISATSRGFIRCNNGTAQQIEEHEQTALRALKGDFCYIDGLSALVLTDSGLLEKVCSFVPNVGICTSVVRLFREEAKRLESARRSVGRGSFVEHRFRFQAKDENAEMSLRQVFLAAADYLDNLPIRQIGKPFAKDQIAYDWDSLIPGYVMDPLRNAQNDGALLMSEDAILVDALVASGESKIPLCFSSLSVVKLLANEGKIGWQDFYKYFSRLSQLRFLLLPISVDELMNAVLEPLGGGLVMVNPSNLELLNLGYTLSKECGVGDGLFVGILGRFFSDVVKEEGISVEAADEIFSIALVRALKSGGRAALRHAVFALCRDLVEGGIYSGWKCDQKLEVLRLQMIRFPSEYNPLVEASPRFLRVTKP